MATCPCCTTIVPADAIGLGYSADQRARKEAAAELDAAVALLNDKEFIRTLHDYRRGHLSYFGQIRERLGTLASRIDPWSRA